MQEKIRPGYKQTEIGVIPEDWDTPSLGSLKTLMTNGFVGTATRHYSREGVGVVYIQGYNVEENSFNVNGIKYVTEEFHKLHMKSCLKAGDLLTVQTGDVGLTTVVPEALAGANCHALIITRFDHRRAHSSFVSYYLNSDQGRARLRLIETGTTMKHLNVGDMLHFVLPLPPFTEQRAIAEALSDADARITALEALIAKKRDLKQAAMQQLLTGKTRLPGFSGEWEVRRLGDHVRFLKNGTLSRAQLAIDAPVRYLHYGDIHGSASLWLHPRSAGMPCVAPELVASLDRLADGDLIFADASEDLDGVGKSIEIADCTETEVVSGLHTIAARFDKEVLADGFKAYLQFMPPFRDHLRSMAAGTKVLATNRKHIGSATLALPEPPEQIAIAEVLSDMDADIAALDAEAEKARTIKQGMMQNLLTGKVRLV